MRVFDPALRQMTEEGLDVFGPAPFQRYIERFSLPSARTWHYVSVDSLDRMSPELRDAGVMVFRLGRRTGIAGTHFGLAKFKNGWSDFFLDDQKLLSSAERKSFILGVPSRRLLSFQILPKLTETSLVNLAVGSGILQYALCMDDVKEHVVPATGQSTFSFYIFPTQGIETPWDHFHGQVEFDAIFSGMRNDKECLFLVEAKVGIPNGTLAKHKLCYPLAALQNQVPSYIDIVPIYLKTWPEIDGYHFLISECDFNRNGSIIVSDLNAIKVTHLVLHGFGR
jgi:hypothetical protein